MVDAKELLPNTYAMITFFNDVNNNETMLTLTVSKAEAMYKKMKSDTDIRLSHTMSVMRACRLFNYKFIAITPMVTLQTDFDRLMLLGGISRDVREGFRSEFEQYKIKSEYEANKETTIDLWTFFVKYQLEMPHTYKGACEAGHTIICNV